MYAQAGYYIKAVTLDGDFISYHQITDQEIASGTLTLLQQGEISSDNSTQHYGSYPTISIDGQIVNKDESDLTCEGTVDIEYDDGEVKTVEVTNCAFTATKDVVLGKFEAGNHATIKYSLKGKKDVKETIMVKAHTYPIIKLEKKLNLWLAVALPIVVGVIILIVCIVLICKC